MTKKKEETALTKSDTQALTTPAPNPYDSDVQVQRLRIVQPTSADGTPGTFINAATKQEFETLHMVPFAYSHGRVYWDKDDRSAPPICKSDNGLVPSSRLDTPFDTQCATHMGYGGVTCSAGKWGEDGEKPECSLTYQLIAMCEEAGPVLMGLSGANIKPFKGLITYSKYTAQVKLQLPYLYNVRVTLELEQHRGAKGNYFTILWRPESLTADEVQEVEPLARQLAGYDVGEHYEAEAKATEDEDSIPF